MSFTSVVTGRVTELGGPLAGYSRFGRKECSFNETKFFKKVIYRVIEKDGRDLKQL
jgi:hypothetical protein